MTHLFYKRTAIVLFALFAFISCNKSEPFDTDDSGEVQTIQVIGPQDIVFDAFATKGTEITSSGALRFTWAIGDTLGIFPTVGNQVEFPISSSDGSSSAVFDGGGWALKNNASYSAYYPFNVWNYHHNNEKIQLDYSGQVQDGNGTFGHLSNYDFLASSMTAPVNSRVTFQMNRVGAILYIDMVVPTPSTIDSLEISCGEAIFTEAAELDISETDPVVNPVKITNKLTLYFKNVTTTTENETVRAYMAVLPVDFSEKTVYATLYTDKGRLGASVQPRSVNKGKAAFLRFSEDFSPVNIVFEDPAMKQACLRWDTDGDGELSYAEAEAVTTIYWHEFGDNTDITSFNEFQYFTGLTSISIGAFSQCENLTSIVIPPSVTSIDSDAFLGCTSLSSISLPEGLTTIGSLCFYSCSSLSSINLPSSLILLGDSCFSNCTALKSISLPENLSVVGGTCFYGCSSLVSVVIPATFPEFSVGSFMNCESLKSFVVPDGMTSLPRFCFAFCNSLEEITIPASIKSIAEGCFLASSALKRVIYGGSLGNWLSINFEDYSATPFRYASDDAYLYINESPVIEPYIERSVNKYALAYQNITSVSFTSNAGYVISLGDFCFCGCDNLTSISIPESVEYLGVGCFSGCNALEEFNGKFASEDGRSLIKDNVMYAFAPSGLSDYTIPSGIERIEDRCFSDCWIYSITIPQTVTSIGAGSFFSCPLSEIIAYPTIAPTIEPNTFEAISQYGLLKYPSGSDYSQWMSTEYGYLGFSNWTSEEIDVTGTVEGPGDENPT